MRNTRPRPKSVHIRRARVARRAPPLTGIEAFLLAARLRSFKEAADALALSPSAFSRRIQALESYLGAKLFDRSAEGLRLTERGTRYVEAISPAFDVIRRASVTPGASRRCVRIALSHSLASNWLIRRLPQMKREVHADIELHISRDPAVLHLQQADMAIWGGMSELAGLTSELLFTADAVVVGCDRRLTISEDGLERVLDHPLLAVTHPGGMWQRWLGQQHAQRELNVVQFDTLQLAYEAARSGLGLALAIPLLAESHLRDAGLHAVAPVRRTLKEAYRLYYADANAAREPALRAIAAWLQDQARRSCDEFDVWWRLQLRNLSTRCPSVRMNGSEAITY